MKITPAPSPNFGPRRHGRGPDMVVLHHTAMLTAKAAVERLCDPVAEVSAHYVISQDGEIIQLVAEDMRAWHAGAGRWGETDDLNSHSIGIELDNSGPLTALPPFPEPQMHALELLLADCMARHLIPPENVIAHSDMAPVRKFDPGAKFDWQRLARQGLSVWPENLDDRDAVQDAAFLKAAAKFGYHLPEDCDTPVATLVSAFRLRFFPGKSGVVDGQDVAAITDLAQRFPSRVGLDPEAGTS